jgi:hypothetical protein
MDFFLPHSFPQHGQRRRRRRRQSIDLLAWYTWCYKKSWRSCEGTFYVDLHATLTTGASCSSVMWPHTSTTIRIGKFRPNQTSSSSFIFFCHFSPGSSSLLFKGVVTKCRVNVSSGDYGLGAHQSGTKCFFCFKSQWPCRYYFSML